MAQRPEAVTVSAPLAMTALEALSTTRAVRRRLDLDRPVPIEIVMKCLQVATQAPTGGGRERWRWLVVQDREQRAAVAELYVEASRQTFAEAAAGAETDRIRRTYEDALYLADNLNRVPLLVIPCMLGKPAGTDSRAAAAYYGSILPAVWSFQVALRSCGLGSCWTTAHLRREREVATVLGIPEGYTQVALIPVAFTIGDGFRPARRISVQEVTYIDRWGRASAAAPGRRA